METTQDSGQSCWESKIKALGPRKGELEHGAYYAGTCRNTRVARWNAEQGKFFYWRNRFNRYTCLETIDHPEDYRGFDVFVVKQKVDWSVPEIPWSTARKN